MPAFQPTANQFRAFRDDPHEGTVCQVNLLKFRVKAEYKETDPEFGEDCSGEAAYVRYSEAFTKAAAEVGGTTSLMAITERYFIGGGRRFLRAPFFTAHIYFARFAIRNSQTLTRSTHRTADISRTLQKPHISAGQTPITVLTCWLY